MQKRRYCKEISRTAILYETVSKKEDKKEKTLTWGLVGNDISKRRNLMVDEKKVYIGNLDFGLTEEDLKKAIEEKGITVNNVKIITDKFSGKSKGFGFAEFENEELAEKAIDSLNEQDLNGRALKVSKARKMRPKDDRNNNFGGGSKFRR